MLDARTCIDIYAYCQKQYDKLAKKDGHYSPKHDKTVFEMAAKEFKMSELQISKAFDLASRTVSKGTDTKAERLLRNKLQFESN